MTSSLDPKIALRRHFLDARRAAFLRLGETQGARLAHHLLAAGLCPAGALVAGTWPMGEEADPRPLLAALAERGHPLALPMVTAKASPLRFRRWSPGEALEKGPHGTHQPLASAPEVTPDILLVPLLAFDPEGHRLGYGGGYYDRTLEGLRAARKVLAIGLAFAAQQAEALPATAHDQRLDWIITENGPMECTR